MVTDAERIDTPEPALVGLEELTAEMRESLRERAADLKLRAWVVT